MTLEASGIGDPKVSLTDALEALHDQAPVPSGDTSLRAWGHRHLGLEGSALSEWIRKVSWGVAAGELIRHHLRQEHLFPAVRALTEPPDWTGLDAARHQGGVLLAGAHLGPPKAALFSLVERRMSLQVWAHFFEDRLGWLSPANQVTCFDPLDSEIRPRLLVHAACHLREGGILYGTPDYPTSSQTHSLRHLGRDWHFSPGFPVLARRLNLPVFLVLALWENQRIRLQCTPIPSPEAGLPDWEWDQLWLEHYWEALEKIIIQSPENLRFLRSMHRKSLNQQNPS